MHKLFTSYLSIIFLEELIKLFRDYGSIYPNESYL